MKEKVLITGASGFLGFHMINAAIENNLEVYAATRSNSDIKHLEDLPIQFLRLNFADQAGLDTLFSAHGFDYVIHAAGTTKAHSQEAYHLVNDTYTQHLAAAAVNSRYPVKRFVFISSLAAIGPIKTGAGKITEDLVPNPVTAYGKSKLAAEKKLSTFNIPVTILRPTAIYGPREKDIFMINQYLNKGFEPYIGRAPQQLSFVYGKDVAELAVKVLGQSNANGSYNISDGNEYTRYDYAAIVKKLLGKKTLQLHLPVPVVKALLFGVEQFSKALNKVPAVSNEKLHELMAENWICDIKKATEELNYQPAYDLESGLRESIEWYKKNNWL
jgi:nucleoside-diphosphate-sugar epimerase